MHIKIMYKIIYIYFMQISIKIYCTLLCKTNTSFNIENRMRSIYFPKPIRYHRMKNKHPFYLFSYFKYLLLKYHTHANGIMTHLLLKCTYHTSLGIQSLSIYPYSMQYTYYPMHGTHAYLTIYIIYMLV